MHHHQLSEHVFVDLQPSELFVDLLVVKYHLRLEQIYLIYDVVLELTHLEPYLNQFLIAVLIGHGCEQLDDEFEFDLLIERYFEFDHKLMNGALVQQDLFYFLKSILVKFKKVRVAHETVFEDL